jgi:hypothetical protein
VNYYELQSEQDPLRRGIHWLRPSSIRSGIQESEWRRTLSRQT